MNSLAGIAMHLDDKLKKILSENNVETYGPAYRITSYNVCYTKLLRFILRKNFF